MRLLRMLAVLLSKLLDRLRRALLAWAGLAVPAETYDAEAVDDRPAVWLEYVRARAPGLVAGKRRLPSQTVPPPMIEPSWLAPATTARVDTTTDIQSPRTAVRPAPVSRPTAPRPTAPRPTAPRAARPAEAPQSPRPSLSTTPAPPPQRSSRPISTPRATAAVTAGQPGGAMVAHTRAPIPVRPAPDATPGAMARPPARPLPEIASRTGAAPRAAPHSAQPEWPAVDLAPVPESRAATPPLVPERPTSARGAPRGGVQADVFEDESLWADLPDTGLRAWEVQSTRSLIREQLHLSRLLKEQAGSSWSALHS